VTGGTYVSEEKQNGEEATGGSDCCPPYNKDIGHNCKNIVGVVPVSKFMLRVSVNASSATNRDAISIFLHGRIELVVMAIWFTLPITCHEGQHGE
jgi:hypothetical protein